VTEHLCAMCIRMLDAQDLHAQLSGHGLQSHFGLSFDIGSLGRSMFSKHESLLSVCVTFVNTDGELRSRCLATPSAGDSHSGMAQMSAVLEALARHPASLTIPLLRTRLACVGGDGAVVRGGPQARHASTGAAEPWAHIGGFFVPSHSHARCQERPWRPIQRVSSVFLSRM
jgi:hypothetical protein